MDIQTTIARVLTGAAEHPVWLVALGLGLLVLYSLKRSLGPTKPLFARYNDAP